MAGTIRYSVPAAHFGHKSTVTVRVYSHHLEVLDHQGRVVASHDKP
ncbi:MAG: Mu transposase domain-containing protein, partial [Anaerolineales bacterium]